MAKKQTGYYESINAETSLTIFLNVHSICLQDKHKVVLTLVHFTLLFLLHPHFLRINGVSCFKRNEFLYLYFFFKLKKFLKMTENISVSKFREFLRINTEQPNPDYCKVFKIIFMRYNPFSRRGHFKRRPITF
jgi:hypothetical protein